MLYFNGSSQRSFTWETLKQLVPDLYYLYTNSEAVKFCNFRPWVDDGGETKYTHTCNVVVEGVRGVGTIAFNRLSWGKEQFGMSARLATGYTYTAAQLLGEILTANGAVYSEFELNTWLAEPTKEYTVGDGGEFTCVLAFKDSIEWAAGNVTFQFKAGAATIEDVLSADSDMLVRGMTKDGSRTINLVTLASRELFTLEEREALEPSKVSMGIGIWECASACMDFGPILDLITAEGMTDLTKLNELLEHYGSPMTVTNFGALHEAPIAYDVNNGDDPWSYTHPYLTKGLILNAGYSTITTNRGYDVHGIPSLFECTSMFGGAEANVPHGKYTLCGMDQ